MPKQKQTKNNWKRLFYVLLVVNVLAVLSIIALVFWPVSPSETPTASDETDKRSSEFTVRTTKQNLNELVNAYMDKLLEGSELQYSVSLDEDVELRGELPAFSSTVPLTVHLKPNVQDNGDVILEQKSISIGELSLPNKKIMDYLKKHLPIPKWVTVDPANEEIYVAVTDMEIRSNFRISVKNFNPETNNLAFNIEVPYESLGIEMKDNLQ